MKHFLISYSIICALSLLIGETLVVMNTNKYWPLSFDDYVAVCALGFAIRHYQKSQNALGLLIVYAYVMGNLYAMLFTRLDPIHGSGERITLLVVALSIAVLGFMLSALAQLKRPRD